MTGICSRSAARRRSRRGTRRRFVDRSGRANHASRWNAARSTATKGASGLDGVRHAADAESTLPVHRRLPRRPCPPSARGVLVLFLATSQARARPCYWLPSRQPSIARGIRNATAFTKSSSSTSTPTASLTRSASSPAMDLCEAWLHRPKSPPSLLGKACPEESA